MRNEYSAPDIDVTGAQRQVGATQQTISNFVSTRTSVGTADAAFSFGAHASRPASGLAGDRYFSTDRTTLYYYSGTAWLYLSGVNVGTNATRAAIVVTANDNGSLFFTTDQNKLWQVSGGAWVDRFVSLDLTTSLKIAGTKVLGAQGAAVADATGGATVDTEARAAINALLARLRAHGTIAT